MVAQGASTATKQLLQNATSDAISSGAITSQVKAQLDARAGRASLTLTLTLTLTVTLTLTLALAQPSPSP